MRKWSSIADLAGLLIARGQAGRTATLSADTAYMVGLKLMTVEAKPTRDEVARLLCDSKCAELCFTCRGKANAVVRAYGHRNDYRDAKGG